MTDDELFVAVAIRHFKCMGALHSERCIESIVRRLYEENQRER